MSDNASAAGRSLNYCPPGTMQIVLGLTPSGVLEPGTRSHMAQTIHRAFLPLGLYVHGADDSTFLCSVKAGNQDQLWGEKIPARHFSTGKSFDQLRRLAEIGEIEPLPHELFEMDVLEMGNYLRVEMEGAFTGVTVWGLTYLNRGPCETVGVAKEGDTHVGRIVQHGLRGDLTVLRVVAPSEDGACRLLECRRSVRV